MQISQKAWNNYIKKLSEVCSEAGNKMKVFVATYGMSNQNAILRYAMRLIQQYGEGSAALACEMYDEIAALSGADVPPAEPAEVASQHEVAKGVVGSLKQSPSGNLISTVVNRLVKQAGADTTLKNAKRDRCEFAWVPSGDTCAFCFMLASAGWRKAGPKTISGDHAEHIHAHCDCQYCIRFDSNMSIAGYDPNAMREKWNSLDGETSTEKLNALRRENYANNKQMNFQDEEDLLKHFNKHLKEFGDITENDYLEKANKLMRKEASDDIMMLRREDDSISKYDAIENEFMVINSDDTIRTFFKPLAGKEYWNAELKRHE